ncbi:MAG: hypothetical protein ACXABY_18305 [Candidatus Thorarchaeota archaeon]|jgi:hypothetical protein
MSIQKPPGMAITRSGHPWDVVRNNQIIKRFLDGGYDYLAKMDVDQVYPQDYFEKLLPLAEKYKVIGPLIFDRWRFNNFAPLMFNKAGYGALEWASIEGQEGVIEIPYAHTNLIYAREVLEKIPAPWYEAHLREDGLDRANHVDFSFLQKIKDAGYKIRIDLDTVVGHLTIQPVTREFHERWNRGS